MEDQSQVRTAFNLVIATKSVWGGDHDQTHMMREGWPGWWAGRRRAGVEGRERRWRGVVWSGKSSRAGVKHSSMIEVSCPRVDGGCYGLVRIFGERVGGCGAAEGPRVERLMWWWMQGAVQASSASLWRQMRTWVACRWIVSFVIAPGWPQWWEQWLAASLVPPGSQRRNFFCHSDDR